MNLKIYWLKFTSAIGTLLGSVVYNFHKHIKGIKTKKNIKYIKNGNVYQKLDVHFPADAKCIYNKEKNRKKVYPCLIYYHGGGWACYSKNLYVTLSRRLAKMGFVVFCCNYTLAPKAKLGDIEKDCLDAFDFVTKTATNFGADANNIMLAGDSAGAHISADLVANFLREGDKLRLERVKGLGLFYGVYDLSTLTKTGFPGAKNYIRASIVGGETNTQELDLYSPIKKDLSGFPPCFLASGEIDKLHKSQSKLMAEKLKEAGVTVSTKFFKKDEARAMHAFMNFDGLSTNVDTLASLERFVNKHIIKEK